MVRHRRTENGDAARRLHPRSPPVSVDHRVPSFSLSLYLSIYLSPYICLSTRSLSLSSRLPHPRSLSREYFRPADYLGCSILGMYLFGGKFCMWVDRSRPCTCAEVVSRHPMCRCDRKHFNDIVWALVTVFQVPLFPPLFFNATHIDITFKTLYIYIYIYVYVYVYVYYKYIRSHFSCPHVLRIHGLLFHLFVSTFSLSLSLSLSLCLFLSLCFV